MPLKTTDFAAAWQAWMKSKGAQVCLEGSASGEYLKNRLWHAFAAGWEASQASAVLSPQRRKVE